MGVVREERHVGLVSDKSLIVMGLFVNVYRCILHYMVALPSQFMLTLR